MSTRRMVSLLVSSALLAAVLGPAAAAPAAAAPAAGSYYLQSAATGWHAAASGDTVGQHRPRGDEDHQQWSLRPAGASYLLANVDYPDRCLGRAGRAVALVDCAGPDAPWLLLPRGGGPYALRAPDADGYLAVSGDATPLVVGGDGDAARWYLTPTSPAAVTLPAIADRRLDQMTFLTAHNAFANGRDGGWAPPVLNFFPNQSRGIDRQLADGVRGFMFDIYQTGDGAILCHQSCTLVSRPVALSTDLARIVAFLRAHPAEFVTVFLEDYVDAGSVLRAELAKVAGLTDLLYRPDLEGVRELGWPTMGELARRDKRLLVFTDHSRSADAAAGLTRDSFGVLYQREWTVENHWSMGSGAGTSDWSCYSRWGSDIPLNRVESGFVRLFVMNHFRDTPIPATIATDNSKLLDRAVRFCEPAARRKPTFVAVDRYDLGDSAAAVSRLDSSAPAY